MINVGDVMVWNGSLYQVAKVRATGQLTLPAIKKEHWDNVLTDSLVLSYDPLPFIDWWPYDWDMFIVMAEENYGVYRKKSPAVLLKRLM